MEAHFNSFGNVRAQSSAGVPHFAREGLTIGASNDQFEQEADSVAADMTRAPAKNSASSHATPSTARYDFSRVRVHTDARAAESAQAVGALAYTVGRDVIFGAGRYAPQTASGRELLAHELTHVVQQQHAPQSGVVQRKGASFGGFFSNIIRSVSEFFGHTMSFDVEELQKYLKGLDETGDIEDDFNSDFKARAVVNAWRLGGSPYALTERRKALLIREMQEGATWDDDEKAILEILERSYNFELSYIFGTGGVKVKDLNSDFHGDEWERLKFFYGRRFEDGDAMAKGNLSKPVGLATPLGEVLPGLSSSMFAEMPGSKAEWDVPCLLGILCSEDQAVVSQLPSLKVQKADEVTEVYWEYDGAAWKMKERERGAFSNAADKVIGLKKDVNCPTAAQHIIHEVHHQNQPATWTTPEKEKDAYTFEEEWLLKRGLPGRRAFRTTKPDTQEEMVNVPAIEEYVGKKYSGATGTAGEQIIDHTTTNETVIDIPGGGTRNRPSQAGDSHQDVDMTKANLDKLPKVDPKEWVCPKIK